MTQTTQTRRAFLESITMTAMLSATGLAADRAQAQTPASTPTGATLEHVHAPRSAPPANSCDCHAHIFDPQRFPYTAKRTYTPGSATVADLIAFEKRIEVDRVVLVQPSGYGTDNRCLLDALKQLGQRARGVAVIDPKQVTPAEIDTLHAAGVRSIRLNLEVKGEHRSDYARTAIVDALNVVAAHKWSIQIYADLELIQSVADTIAQANTPFVLDHFGGLKAGKGLAQAGFDALLELVRKGNAYVKLSAPYRASKLSSYADLAPFAQKLIETAPDRLIWASDWPHTGSSGNRSGDLNQIEPFRQIDEGAVMDQLRDWMPNDATYRKILVDNPARLYGFPA